ncbi:MAG: M48 family metalloprotease [Chloroflexi bacterium]|nr:M48 family metalloprotease [Chloroflexota bacterium]
MVAAIASSAEVPLDMNSVLDPPDRQALARAYGAARRRLYLANLALSLLVPLAGYWSGASEGAWYALAATEWPLAIRAMLFLGLLHVAISLVDLPLAWYGGHVLPQAVGQSRQSFPGWLADWTKSMALGVLFAVLAAGWFYWSFAQWGERWWVVVASGYSLAGVSLTFIAPYVIVPLFFRMRPVDDANVRQRIEALSERAGARVREVCTLDFSRRTADGNAAVLGIGRSRRVVVSDTLLASFPADEVDAVVAHELGHHVHRDVPRLLLVHLLSLWVGLALAAWGGPRLLPVLSQPTLGYVPAYPQVLALAGLWSVLSAPLLNVVSRRAEARADQFALRVTGQPRAFASAMRRLGQQNLAEMQPPRWAELLLGTHPSLASRVRAAETFEPGRATP